MIVGWGAADQPGNCVLPFSNVYTRSGRLVETELGSDGCPSPLFLLLSLSAHVAFSIGVHLSVPKFPIQVQFYFWKVETCARLHSDVF